MKKYILTWYDKSPIPTGKNGRNGIFFYLFDEKSKKIISEILNSPIIDKNIKYTFHEIAGDASFNDVVNLITGDEN